jgi:putative ABC transport system substrate-binding protein
MTRSGGKQARNVAAQQAPDLILTNAVCWRGVELRQRMQFGLLKRRFISLLGSALFACPLSAQVQQHERREITIWMGRPNDAEGQRLGTAFREAFQAVGWVNGRNVRIDYRWVTTDIDRLNLAKEVIEQNPEVIVAETTAAVAALSSVSKTIPIVFVNVSDPIGAGFVATLAKPSGAITGFISNEPTLGSKWPGLLKEIAPTIERMGFLFNPDTAPYAEPFFRQAEASALALGLKLISSPIHSDPEIERTIAVLGSTPGSGLLVLPDFTTNTHSARIIELAAQHRLPVIYAYRSQTFSGGLMSYGPDLADSFRGAASYVDRILRGEKPENLPVQAPTKFSLVVNLKTARDLGLTVPDKLLGLADEVIE